MSAPVSVAFTPGSLAGWLGGTNYLGSLLRVLAEHPEAGVRPALVLGSSAPEPPGMPAAELIRTRLLDPRHPLWAAGAAGRRLFDADPMFGRLMRSHGIDVISHSKQIWSSRSPATIAWLPDFQHIRMPQLFSARERRSRDKVIRRWLDRCTLMILSSESARTDLEALAPEGLAKVRVLHFVTEPASADAERAPEEAAATHGIDGPFIYLPNQFWVHKNHAVVIEALGILRSRGLEATVVASGDTHDHRRPGHFAELTARAEALGVSGSFRTLGRIDYADVVALMRGAAAVLNPSLCEGWSTTVEEAKSLGKRSILSDIDVHREQAPADAAYFPADDPEALAVLIEQALADPDPGRDAERAREAAVSLPARRRGYALAYGEIAREAVALARRG